MGKSDIIPYEAYNKTPSWQLLKVGDPWLIIYPHAIDHLALGQVVVQKFSSTSTGRFQVTFVWPKLRAVDCKFLGYA